MALPMIVDPVGVYVGKGPLSRLLLIFACRISFRTRCRLHLIRPALSAQRTTRAFVKQKRISASNPNEVPHSEPADFEAFGAAHVKNLLHNKSGAVEPFDRYRQHGSVFEVARGHFDVGLNPSFDSLNHDTHVRIFSQEAQHRATKNRPYGRL